MIFEPKISIFQGVHLIIFQMVQGRVQGYIYSRGHCRLEYWNLWIVKGYHQTTGNPTLLNLIVYNVEPVIFKSLRIPCVQLTEKCNAVPFLQTDVQMKQYKGARGMMIQGFFFIRNILCAMLMAFHYNWQRKKMCL